jgi:hypothetical protein
MSTTSRELSALLNTMSRAELKSAVARIDHSIKEQEKEQVEQQEAYCLWLTRVDSILYTAYGLSTVHQDLKGLPFREWFNSGTDPSSAARLAGSVIFGGANNAH